MAAGEAGVGGGILQRLESQSMWEEGFDLSTIEANRISKIRQGEYQKTALQQSLGAGYLDSSPSLGWTLAKSALQIPTSYYSTKKSFEEQ